VSLFDGSIAQNIARFELAACSETIIAAVSAKVLDGEWQRLGEVTPVPGMPVEAFIQTGERTALAYLTKPFMD